MRERHFLFTLSICVSLLSMLACATTKPTGPAPEPELLMSEQATQAVDLGSLQVRADWELQNPTAVPASVESIDWRFEVDGMETLTQTDSPSGSAAPGQSIEGAIIARTNLTPDESSPGATPRVLHFHLYATFKVRTPTGLDEYESAWHGELLAPRELEVAAFAGAARYGGTSYEMNVNLDLTNPNAFPMQVGEFSYSLFIDEVDLGGGNLFTDREIAPGATMQFDVGRVLDKTKYGNVISQLRGRQKIPFRIETSVLVAGESYKRPIFGTIDFD